MSSEFGSVLVVGGCGFLGHHIVSQLLQKGCTKISVIDLNTGRNRLLSVQYFDGDITNASTVKSIFQKVRPQTIFHTASPTVLTKNAPIYFKVNVEGTRNLLEQAGQIGCVKAFVYTSSASVVHDSVSDLFDADESLPVLSSPQQREPYSHTKGIADNLVLAANRTQGNMLTVSLRPSAMFGEGDVQMLPGVLKVYESGKTHLQLGNNQKYFDFTYVGNSAHAHILAAQKLLSSHSKPPPNDARVDGEAFFITNDEPFHWWDFCRAIWNAAGDRSDPKKALIIPKGVGLALAMIVEWIFWIFLSGREPPITRQKVRVTCMTRTFCVDKAKHCLGYRPLVNMTDGIQKGVEWYQEGKQQTAKKIV